MDGILAAQLASEGFEAAIHLLDAERGLQGTLIQDRSFGIAPVTYDDGWELQRNGFKPYACCRSIHASVDAARKLAPELVGARIKRVHVRAHRGATVPAHHFDPQTPLQGKFSFPFCMALGLRGYPVVEADFSEARLCDPEIMAIIPHVTVEEIADQSRWESHLEVILEGGERRRSDQDIVLGHPDNPMTWEDMAQKFLGLVEPVLGADARPLLQALRNVDKPGQLAEVMRVIRRDNHAMNESIS